MSLLANMVTYTTITGREIDVESLAPEQVTVLFRLVRLAGGHSFLDLKGLPAFRCGGEPFQPLAPSSLGGDFKEPEAFWRACMETFMFLEFADEARAGPLVEILQDAHFRLWALRFGWDLSELRYDARMFLWKQFRDVGGNLRVLSARTDIGYTQVSRLMESFRTGLSDDHALSLDQLTTAARGCGVPFSMSPPPKAQDIVSLRDRRHQRFARRAQVFSTALAQIDPKNERPRLLDEISWLSARSLGRWSELDRVEAWRPSSMYVIHLPNPEACRKLDWLFLGEELGWLDGPDFSAFLVAESSKLGRVVREPEMWRFSIGASSTCGSDELAIFLEGNLRLLDEQYGKSLRERLTWLSKIGMVARRDPELQPEIEAILSKWSRRLGIHSFDMLADGLFVDVNLKCEMLAPEGS